METIEQIKGGPPAKIVSTGTPVNFECRILSFEWGECDGSGDIRFSISLQEHRAVSVKASAVVTLSSLEGAGTTVDGNGVARTQPEQAAKTYTVKSGDCLSAIARKMTGSADWMALYNANRSGIGGNPNLIKRGQVITIP